MGKNAVTKLSLVRRYVPDPYKNWKMCNKVILKNGGTLKSVPHCYKIEKVSNKAVDNYVHALEFVPNCYKLRKCVKLLILVLLQYNWFLNSNSRNV